MQDYFIHGESDEARRARWDREDAEQRREWERDRGSVLSNYEAAKIQGYAPSPSTGTLLFAVVMGLVFGTLFGAVLMFMLQVNGHAVVH